MNNETAESLQSKQHLSAVNICECTRYKCRTKATGKEKRKRKAKVLKLADASNSKGNSKT